MNKAQKIAKLWKCFREECKFCEKDPVYEDEHLCRIKRVAENMWCSLNYCPEIHKFD